MVMITANQMLRCPKAVVAANQNSIPSDKIWGQSGTVHVVIVTAN